MHNNRLSLGLVITVKIAPSLTHNILKTTAKAIAAIYAYKQPMDRT